MKHKTPNKALNPTGNRPANCDGFEINAFRAGLFPAG